ncbi:LytR C-terminal domain-containing protein [Zhihengliuella halotolerans]|uniref:LytR cell envelope-related transcriptional attenuator n=1 Tax=Zhihengliuella halotolerans TaxID=370736 RepID=A0A4Q8A941_9MICC|nr:LytR C-terminal domain-containing protein [Zhihengliuella halotolerans]RZU60587.1 LytR cell envelope-related transcriptional attenuator [Zhihengliuella halotolerans]
MSKYPSDEFDRVPEYTDRQGVHRLAAGMAPARRGGLWPVLIFGVAAILIGLVAFFLLRPTFGGDQQAAPSPPPSASVSAPASDSASEDPDDESDEASSSPEETAAPGSGEPDTADESEAADLVEETPEADASEDAAADESDGVLDRNLPVGVYNGSGIGGLAGTNTAQLRSAGYSQVVSGNWTRQVEPSVVYYKNDWAATTARDVADQLGIGTIYQTENVPVEISVVLGSAGR